MPLIATDWSIAANGDIRYVGDAHGGASPSYATGLEFYRWLQDLSDNDVEIPDDLMSMIRPNAANRNTNRIFVLNAPYNIDDNSAEYLFDCSIEQDTGNTVYAGLQVQGAVGAGTQPMVVQNNAFLTNYWGTGLNADPASNIIMSIMVKVRTGGADIDGRRLRVQARELGDEYFEFGVQVEEGVGIAFLATKPDANNQTAEATIATWTSIVNTEGYQLLDLNNGNGPQPYYSQWDVGIQSINDLYERTKWIQRRGSVETIHGISGELFRGINQQWAYDNELGGPFAQDEILSWGTGDTAGTALLLALDDNGATGTMWVQLLTGVAPTDGLQVTGGTSSATCDVDGAAIARSITPTFIGTSTGSAISGAFGIGVDPADLSASDKVTDLLNVLQTPPNNQVFTVSGLSVGEDRVLVTQNDGANGVDYDQFAADGAQSSGLGTLTIVGAIPGDTPTSGFVYADNGTIYDRLEYTSYTGSVFTLNGTLPSNIANTADVFLGYIDELSGSSSATFTATFAGNRSLLVRVRYGGAAPIRPYQSPATFTATGGGAVAIRTPDV